MGNLVHGFAALGSFQAIAYLLAGALIGAIVGVIPGLSTVIILSVILVFTQYLNLTNTLCLFLGAQCGGFYAASVSAILINTPAHPEAYPITLDGYPMARKGQPARALGLSACSTCVGGFIGCGVLVVFLQVLDSLPDLFHAPDYVALVTLAMLLVGTLAADSVGKAVVSAGVGLLLASVGASPITGVYRYTFGSVSLGDGLSLVAVALGVFAVPQMIMVFGTGKATARQDITGREIDDSEQVEVAGPYAKQLLKGVGETFKHWGVLLQSGLVGGLTGIVPGIGGFTGNFMAYGIARQLSRKRQEFGTGTPDGIIAPEGSSLAKEAGHIVPIIGLGIPGGTAGALFIGALAMKGMKVGYGFQDAYPNVTGQIVLIIMLSGLIGTVAGVIIGPQLAKVTRVPGPLIVPAIFVLSVSGPFFTTVTFFAVLEMFVFGLIGLGFRRLRYPLGPFMLGLVLGPTFETNVYLTHTVSPGFSWVTQRPLADAIFAICILLLVSKALEVRRSSKARKRQDGETAREKGLWPRVSGTDAPYSVLALLMTLFLLGVGLYFVIYAKLNYDFATGVMPFIGGVAVALPALLFLPRDIRQVVLYWRRRRAPAGEGVRDQGGSAIVPSSPPPAPPNAGHGGSAPVMLAARTDVQPQEAPAAAPIREKTFGANGQYRREVIAVAMLALLIALCWFVGFSAATAIFIVIYGLTCTKRHFKRLRSRIIYTAVMAVVMWAVVYEMFVISHVTFTPLIHT